MFLLCALLNNQVVSTEVDSDFESQHLFSHHLHLPLDSSQLDTVVIIITMSLADRKLPNKLFENEVTGTCVMRPQSSEENHLDFNQRFIHIGRLLAEWLSETCVL